MGQLKMRSHSQPTSQSQSRRRRPLVELKNAQPSQVDPGNALQDSGHHVACSSGLKPVTAPSEFPAFETWRLESDGMSGAVRLSEFADKRPVADEDKGPVDVYKRPSNKRDL